MKRYSNRSNFSTLSEINVTPLLDLAFVLLIIFMITTPLLENSMNLVIPSSSAANPPVSKMQVQTISIDRAETIRPLHAEVLFGCGARSRSGIAVRLTANRPGTFLRNVPSRDSIHRRSREIRGGSWPTI